jgi:hypothetical protein
MGQLMLFENSQPSEVLKAFIMGVLDDGQRPSAHELLAMVEKDLGLKFRWVLTVKIRHAPGVLGQKNPIALGWAF